MSTSEVDLSHGRGSSLDPDQLQRLLTVGRGLVSELDVDAVLDQVLAVARELTGAAYAALGVLDAQHRELERFVTSGIDEAERRTIGDLPRGHGVLGVLIEDPRPLRLANVGRHPKSYGFPPGHPQMTTFLGVPIRIRGDVFGNVYLAEKDRGAFTEADEEAICVLADWAAIAIDNARAYGRESERRVELERAVAGLEATIDISRALGGETDLDRVLELIAKRARALVDARLVTILLADDARRTLRISATAGEADDELLEVAVPVDDSLCGEVFTSGVPERVVGVAERLRHGLGRRVGAETGLMMPLVFRGQSLGVLAAFDRSGGAFDARDERVLESFAFSAATAVATAQRVAAQALRQSIEASERERTRWARELHDETLQELAGLKVLLASSAHRDETVELAMEQIDQSITSLRHLITELRPAALDEYGLVAAIEALVERVRGASGLTIAAQLALDGDDGSARRFGADVESALYRLVQEALTNAVRHASASAVRLAIREEAEGLVVEVVDDGCGFDVAQQQADGFGLRGMRERVELVGGSLALTSAPGAGTSVRAIVPVTPTSSRAERAARSA